MAAVNFRGLDALSRKAKAASVDLPIESVSLSLRDLIGYLYLPGEHLEHEDKQNRLQALKNRQNLFQEEVSSLVPVSLPLSSWETQSLVGSSSFDISPFVTGAAGVPYCLREPSLESQQLPWFPSVCGDLLTPQHRTECSTVFSAFISL